MRERNLWHYLVDLHACNLTHTHLFTYTYTHSLLADDALLLTLHISRQLSKVSQFDFHRAMKLSHSNIHLAFIY